MKYRDLTIDYISTLDKDGIREARWAAQPVSTCVHKTLKKLEGKAIMSDSQAKELIGTRNAVAKVDALMQAIMCREDELFGAGVLSSYDHTERFC